MEHSVAVPNPNTFFSRKLLSLAHQVYVYIGLMDARVKHKYLSDTANR